MSRNIFLDCGANKGQSVDYFRRIRDPRMKYEVYCFEPDPRFDEVLKRKGVNHNKSAVWVEDGEITFYVKESLVSSSLFKQKKTGGRTIKEIKVPSIDFSKYVMENFDKSDYIYLKMDIEGAEFAVLDKMMKDGSIEYINALSIEFHGSKVDKRFEGKGFEFLERLKEYDIEMIEDWNTGND